MTASLTHSFIYSTKVRVCIFQPPYLKKKKTRGGMHHSVRPCGKGAFSGDMKPQTARLGIYLYSVHNRFGRSQTGWPCWFTVGMSAVRGKMLPFGATPCETKQFLELGVGKTPREPLKQKDVNPEWPNQRNEIGTLVWRHALLWWSLELRPNTIRQMVFIIIVRVESAFQLEGSSPRGPALQNRTICFLER